MAAQQVAQQAPPQQFNFTKDCENHAHYGQTVMLTGGTSSATVRIAASHTISYSSAKTRSWSVGVSLPETNQQIGVSHTATKQVSKEGKASLGYDSQLGLNNRPAIIVVVCQRCGWMSKTPDQLETEARNANRELLEQLNVANDNVKKIN